LVVDIEKKREREKDPEIYREVEMLGRYFL
jgi:hypothetical protein